MSLDQKFKIRISIKYKIFIPFLFIILPVLIAGFIFFYKSSEIQLIDEITEKSVYKIELIKKSFENTGNKAVSIASGFASLQGIDAAYAMKNELDGRNLIRKITAEQISSIQKNSGIKSLKVHYHKPPAKSFVRLWRKPGEGDGGDDLTKFRFSILDISKTHQAISSIEVGRGGPEIRGMAPVFSGGNYIGSVEVLFDLNDMYKLIEKKDTLSMFIHANQASIINEKAIVARFKKTGNYVFAASSDKNKMPENINPAMLSKSESGTVSERTGDYFTSYSVIKDYKGNILGSLAITTDISEQIKEMNKLNLALLTVLILVFILLFVVMLILINKIHDSITMVTESFHGVADGDLTHNLEVKSFDEVGDLTKYYNVLLVKINSVIKEIKSGSDTLADSTMQISSSSISLSGNLQSQAASVEEITATTEEIASGMENVAHNASEQNDNLKELIDLMDKLSEIINDISGRIQETSSMAAGITSEAQKGEITLKEMAESMTNVKNSSNEMNNIVNIINDISDKINLLSLNAAIEAARAGDAGRGFAVVADEISKLADKTSTSISEIDNLIKSNEKDIDKGMSRMGETYDLITHIIKSVNSIKEVIESNSGHIDLQLKTKHEAVDKAKLVIQQSEQIKMSTSEQKIAIDEVAKSVVNLNQMIQANSGESEEISSTGEEISVIAGNLKKMIEFFKV